MATVAHKLGPGLLTLGAVGSESQWGAQCTKTEITPDFSDGEVIDVLDGTQVLEADTTSWKVAGSVVESYDAASLIAWSWEHKDQDMPFKFKPRNDQVLQVSGTLKVRPLGVGGDVKKTNQRDFEFKVIGDPVMATAP